jgi:hypothetical protein
MKYISILSIKKGKSSQSHFYVKSTEIISISLFKLTYHTLVPHRNVTRTVLSHCWHYTGVRASDDHVYCENGLVCDGGVSWQLLFELLSAVLQCSARLLLIPIGIPTTQLKPVICQSCTQLYKVWLEFNQPECNVCVECWTIIDPFIWKAVYGSGITVILTCWEKYHCRDIFTDFLRFSR